MTLKRLLLLLLACGTLCIAPTLLFAHPLPHPKMQGGLGAGFLHPLLGLDHLLAMVGVGLWAAQQSNRRAVWVISAAFLGFMSIGFGLGVRSSALPLVELGIVASVALVGALILFKRQVPLFVGTALAGLFAVFHGHAHGTDPAVGLSWLNFGVGFLLASGVLLVMGAAVWRIAERVTLQQSVSRSAGGTLLTASSVFIVLLF